MGQPAFKLEETVTEAPSADVIQLKAGTAAAARPSLSVVEARADLPGLLSMITRASSLIGAQKDRADSSEKRALAAEDLLKAANRKIAEIEIKLRSALDEARVERERAAEVQKRSSEVVDKTRTMLGEAGERVRAAEGRAERAESSYATLRSAVEQGLSTHIR